MQSVARGPASGSLGSRDVMDEESRTSCGSSLAWSSLDVPLHTKQQVVPEELRQGEVCLLYTSDAADDWLVV